MLQRQLGMKNAALAEAMTAATAMRLSMVAERTAAVSQLARANGAAQSALVACRRDISGLEVRDNPPTGSGGEGVYRSTRAAPGRGLTLPPPGSRGMKGLRGAKTRRVHGAKGKDACG